MRDTWFDIAVSYTWMAVGLSILGGVLFYGVFSGIPAFVSSVYKVVEFYNGQFSNGFGWQAIGLTLLGVWLLIVLLYTIATIDNNQYRNPNN